MITSRSSLAAQLYTVRAFLQTMPEVNDSLKKIAAIGYKAVQLSGVGPVDPADLARALKDHGLYAAATHVPWADFLNDLEGVIHRHKLWGCHHAAIGGLPSEYFSGLDGVKRFVDELAPVAQRLASEGMDFSYHNHSHELQRFGEKTWLAALYEQAPPSMLKAEIDVYWIQAGGGEPAQWIKKLGRRQPLLHLKDMQMLGREQRFAEIGLGNLNWPPILEAARSVNVEWYFVEQDNCWGRDPFESLAISYRNLREMGLS